MTAMFGTELEEAYPNTDENDPTIPIFIEKQTTSNEYIPNENNQQDKNQIMNQNQNQKEKENNLDYKVLYDEQYKKTQMKNNIPLNNIIPPQIMEKPVSYEKFTAPSSSSAESIETTNIKNSVMIKPILYALYIVLAVSLHYVITYLIEHFVTASGTFSIRQEIMIRVCYPLIILLLIWLIKFLR